MLGNILWLLGTALVTFTVSAFFAGKLKLRRNAFLVAYVPATVALGVGYYLWSGIDPIEQSSVNWYWAVLAIAVASFIAIRNVRSQPASERRSGAGFALDLLWPGFAYGFVDGLVLSVLPVLAVQSAFGPLSALAAKIGVGALAFVVSLFVTFLYHVGYPEFRNKNVLWTLLGNGIFSLAFLLTGNPLAAVVSHVVMHIAAVMHGHETTFQLPPHNV